MESYGNFGLIDVGEAVAASSSIVRAIGGGTPLRSGKDREGGINHAVQQCGRW
jgi:hypothetical protein